MLIFGFHQLFTVFKSTATSVQSAVIFVTILVKFGEVCFSCRIWGCAESLPVVRAKCRFGHTSRAGCKGSDFWTLDIWIRPSTVVVGMGMKNWVKLRVPNRLFFFFLYLSSDLFCLVPIQTEGTSCFPAG